LGASHARNLPEPVRTPASEQVTAGMFTANNMKRSVLNGRKRKLVGRLQIRFPG
jgi:hypothetical protein